MTYRNRIQFMLVHGLKISKQRANELLATGQVLVNGKVESENVLLSAADEVKVEGKVIQKAIAYQYIAFYKPRGVETTLNPEIQNNLVGLLPFSERLFPIGRLDKESEGLLILTNDGGMYNTIIKHENYIEKEYLVTVHRPIDDDFILRMSSGIKIMGKLTLPCPVVRLDDCIFRIVLTQGLNRQIRRMCYQLDYEVLQLVRIRIGGVRLENLRPQQFRILEKMEILNKEDF